MSLKIPVRLSSRNSRLFYLYVINTVHIAFHWLATAICIISRKYKLLSSISIFYFPSFSSPSFVHCVLLPPSSLPGSHVFGVPLTDLVTSEGQAIPKIVRKIVEHIEREGEGKVG